MSENEIIFQLTCDTCGNESCFESNEDKTYVKCSICGREYSGGIDELKELNQERIREIAIIEARKLAKEAANRIIKTIK
jgi:ribosomal protein S27E